MLLKAKCTPRYAPMPICWIWSNRSSRTKRGPCYSYNYWATIFIFRGIHSFLGESLDRESTLIVSRENKTSFPWLGLEGFSQLERKYEYLSTWLFDPLPPKAMMRRLAEWIDLQYRLIDRVAKRHSFTSSSYAVDLGSGTGGITIEKYRVTVSWL